MYVFESLTLKVFIDDKVISLLVFVNDKTSVVLYVHLVICVCYSVIVFD